MNENTPCLDPNQPEIVAPRANTEPVFQVINGTSYKIETSPEVIALLECYRKKRGHTDGRIVIHYGDSKTGRAWGDIETGYIGRSMGPIQIPLLIYNRRSMGGAGLLDHCIVKIQKARGKYVLYQHPTFFGPS